MARETWATRRECARLPPPPRASCTALAASALRSPSAERSLVAENVPGFVLEGGGPPSSLVAARAGSNTSSPTGRAMAPLTIATLRQRSRAGTATSGSLENMSQRLAQPQPQQHVPTATSQRSLSSADENGRGGALSVSTSASSTEPADGQDVAAGSALPIPSPMIVAGTTSMVNSNSGAPAVGPALAGVPSSEGGGTASPRSVGTGPREDDALSLASDPGSTATGAQELRGLSLATWVHLLVFSLRFDEGMCGKEEKPTTHSAPPPPPGLRSRCSHAARSPGLVATAVHRARPPAIFHVADHQQPQKLVSAGRALVRESVVQRARRKAWAEN